jgi:hypothetical protein
MSVVGLPVTLPGVLVVVQIMPVGRTPMIKGMRTSSPKEREIRGRNRFWFSGGEFDRVCVVRACLPRAYLSARVPA